MAQGYWPGSNSPQKLANLTAEISGITNTPATVLQFTLPPLAAGNIVLLHLGMAKSGTTDPGRVQISVGGSNLLNGTVLLGAANRSGGSMVGFRVESATSVRTIRAAGSGNPFVFYQSATGATDVASVTVADLATPREIIVTAFSGGATDTVDVQHAWMELIK